MGTGDSTLVLGIVTVIVFSFGEVIFSNIFSKVVNPEPSILDGIRFRILITIINLVVTIHEDSYIFRRTGSL